MDYNNTIKTIRMTAVLDAIDAGLAAGTLEICTAAYAAVLLTFTFSYPCGAVAGDPAAVVFAGMPKQATGEAAGQAAAARIKDSTGSIVASDLTVGLVGSGANVEIDSLGIQAGQIVNLTSGQLVHG